MRNYEVLDRFQDPADPTIALTGLQAHLAEQQNQVPVRLASWSDSQTAKHRLPDKGLATHERPKAFNTFREP